MTKSTRLLIVFAKTPVAGQVKTRIGAVVGMSQAADIYQLMLEKVLTETATNDDWQQVIAIPPESDQTFFRQKGLAVVRQRGDGLGSRMGNALLQGCHGGVEQVVIIGSDCPTIARQEVAAAFELLDSVPVVIGPSEDGGFYLIGATREQVQTVSDIFHEAIPWSTPQVLERVQALFGQAALPLALLPLKQDIDTYEDWQAYQLMQSKGR